jgi:hypothetical protein
MFEELAKMDIKDLSDGEEVRIPLSSHSKKRGNYTIHAYLYDVWKRIDQKTNIVYAQKK